MVVLGVVLRRMQRIMSSEKGTFGNAQSGPASGQLAIERWR